AAPLARGAPGLGDRGKLVGGLEGGPVTRGARDGELVQVFCSIAGGKRARCVVLFRRFVGAFGVETARLIRGAWPRASASELAPAFYGAATAGRERRQQGDLPRDPHATSSQDRARRE